MLKILKPNWIVVVLLLIAAVVMLKEFISYKRNKIAMTPETDSTWEAPSLFTDQVTQGKERDLVMYGEDLIAHTAKYFGPNGSVLQITNGMNCQNCHLDAGTQAWGNNFGAVYATYPKFRERSGTVEDIYKRVDDCFERSLNGKAIDKNSHEMQAIYTYIKWLGQGVPKNKKPYGSGLEKLPFLDRAASPEAGRLVYNTKCQSCHSPNGEGQADLDGKSFAVPPLWGNKSYNDGAGLYRLSNFAAFVKNNMPFGQANHGSPVLSLEQAWDVAAFVNSQPRPHIDQSKDWHDITKKPVDFPFGPYADSFSVQQHKFGPYKPMLTEKSTQQKSSLK
ncbi:MAG TPA: c-type cytochrome [Flavisolibacter sp.]|nr:c-type cytochrome [Flavisolibacter sp.]